jgi:hypothetical protein
MGGGVIDMSMKTARTPRAVHNEAGFLARAREALSAMNDERTRAAKRGVVRGDGRCSRRGHSRHTQQRPLLSARSMLVRF